MEKFIREWEGLYSDKKVLGGQSDIVSWLLYLNSEDLRKTFDGIETCIKKTKTDKKPHTFFAVNDSFCLVFCSHYGRDQLRNHICNYGMIKKYEFKKNKLLCLGTDTSTTDNYFINEVLICDIPHKKNDRMDKILDRFKKESKK